MTTPDPLAVVRSPRPRRPLARAIAALALIAGLTAMPAASALAQSGGDEIFTTAATGLAEVGSSDLSWFTADVDIAEGDPVQDLAAGAAGFLLVDRGGLMITADGGRRTLLDVGDALFVAADDQLQLQGVGDDATVWRIAVVADGADPLSDGDDVGTTVEAETPGASGAPDDAPRKVSLRMGDIEDGDDPTAGGDDESVPLVVAIDGDLILGDEEFSEGSFAGNPEADRDGGVDIEADGDALAAYVAVGPPLDPDDLTAGGSGDDDGPSTRPTPRARPRRAPAAGLAAARVTAPATVAVTPTTPTVTASTPTTRRSAAPTPTTRTPTATALTTASRSSTPAPSRPTPTPTTAA